MRIAEIATAATPVRPETGGTGSVEGLVWTLAHHLTAEGHDVTVFGAAGSDVAGSLEETLPGPYGTNCSPDDWQLCEWINLCRAIEMADDFDVLHSHAYLWGLPLERLSVAPMVHSLHVWPYEDSAALFRAHPDAWVTALSDAQWRDHPGLSPSAIIPHGVEPTLFPFRATSGSDACYLGRFIPGKGAVAAVKAARAAGIHLILAGPENAYFRRTVAPLVDGRDVEYVGPVSASERAELLGGAGVLLAPFRAPEPFCLVLAEAMMCGTPVVSTAVGAAPEIVDPGITGFCAEAPRALPDLVRAALDLDRTAVRTRAEERFSAARMAADYLAILEKAASR